MNSDDFFLNIIDKPLLSRVVTDKNATSRTSEKNPPKSHAVNQGLLDKVKENYNALMPFTDEEVMKSKPLSDKKTKYVGKVVNSRKRAPDSENEKETFPKKRKTNFVVTELKASDVSLALKESVSSKSSSTMFVKEHFNELNIFDPKLVACLQQRLDITKVSGIQKKSFPAILAGHDVLIKSQTGSGKTLAYALPIMQTLQALDPPINRGSGLMALVITPTRELAQQTYETFTTIGKPFVRIVSGCLVGGVTMKAQKNTIRKGLNIIVATPQRLMEHIRNTSVLQFTELRWLVLDEADRMLEMGYQKIVSEIIEAVHSVVTQVQTILLSATLSAEVEKLATLSLKEPVRCIMKSAGQSETSEEIDMPAGLKHFIMIVSTKLRLVVLASFLLLKCRYNLKGGKVIVFVSTQHSVDFHHTLFERIFQPSLDPQSTEKSHSIELFKLHGNIDHKERQRTFQSFRSCSNGILFTTDVASRGVDISCVAWVIQYNPPTNAVDYIHRVGRTARAGGKGKAVLFLSPDEREFATHLQTKLSSGGHGLQALPVAQLLRLCYVKEQSYNKNTTPNKRMGGKEKQAYLERCTAFQRQCELEVSKDEELKTLAEKAFTSFIRSYATFSVEMRQIFAFHKLHLGHMAKAYGLCETPKEIASKMRQHREKNPEKWKRKMSSEESSFATRNSKVKSMKKSTDHAKRNMLAEYGVW